MAHANQPKLKIQTAAERAEEARRFELPNPGDLMIALVFGWAFFCFFLVTGGKRMLGRVAKLAKSPVIEKELMAGDETILTTLMLGGCAAFIILVFVCYRYRKALIGFALVSFTFGSANWRPLHDSAWIIKYLIIVFLTSFAGLFIIKNFWRLTSTPYIRLLFLLYFWVAFIQLALGQMDTDAIWYVGTETAFMIGFAIAWLNYIKTTDDLREFIIIMSWAAVVITILHALSPVLAPEHMEGRRFSSYFRKSTGYAVFFSPVVLALFWRAMDEDNTFLRQFFLGMSMIAMALIAWSQTRSAALGLIITIGMLWWVFRARILIYLFIGAVFALTVQIIGGGGAEQIEAIQERLSDTDDTGRFEVWAVYLDFFTQSPIFGHSSTGVKKLFYSSADLAFLDAIDRDLRAPAPHNAFIGMAARFGIIGLGLLIAPIFIALRRARQVLTSPEVPLEEKKVYVFPAALVVLICICSVFEDALASTGKGTITGFVFWPALIFCEVFGAKLMEKYAPQVAAAKPKSLQRTSLDAGPEKA